MNLIFNPPLYLQRYQFVIEFVRRLKPKKVVDLGCNDCTLMRKLKFHRDIELLAGVDIDGAVMKDKMYELAPMSTDYLQPTDGPMTIEVYQGSVTDKDPRMKGFDLVTSIELIEHLQLADVDQFSEMVFGYMRPASVIISTPNADFNPLLPGLTGFRHYDHKFEWTRDEFETWASKLCIEHDYSVEFTGVGEAPAGQQSVGFCSQIGVFHRLMARDEAAHMLRENLEMPTFYSLLYSVAYPSLRDNNILQRTLGNEVLYWAEQLRQQWLKEMAGVGEETGLEEEVHSMDMMCTEKIQIHGLREGERGLVAHSGGRSEEVEGGRTEPAPEPYRQGQSVCIPLTRLWLIPRVETLGKTLRRLREVLLDDSRVQLSDDGTAVVLADHEDEDEYFEDSEASDICQPLVSSKDSGEDSEDWEAELS